MRRLMGSPRFYVAAAVLSILSGSSARAAGLFDVPLRINMGGAETVDSFGRTWLGDGPGEGADPLGIRPDDLGGSHFIENWSQGLGQFQPDSIELLGFDPTHPGDVYILDSIRWDEWQLSGEYRLEIPIPAGEYTVNLYFNEGCCPNRHFRIEIQDEVVDDDVSYLDYDPVAPGLGRAGVLSFDGVTVGAEEILRIALLPIALPCPAGIDCNAILNALEVISGPDCGHLGLDFNCVYDPAADEVTGTWRSAPGADGYRILKDGQPFGGALGPDATSFVDRAPRSGGAVPEYAVQALDGGVPFRECRCSVSAFSCPRDLACEAATSGEVALSWAGGAAAGVTGFEVRRNGVLIATLPATATTYEDEPGVRRVDYEVVPLSDPPGRCAPMTCSVSTFVPFEIPLRINMGGRETVDSRGRLWLGDGPGADDPLDIRANDASGTNTIENWCGIAPETMRRCGLDPTNGNDVYIFSTIRWDVGNDGQDFYVELPVPNGDYFVALYFNECCCPNRHFKIELQGEIVDEDVSYLDYDSAPALGKLGRLGFEDVPVWDGILRIGLLPCFECPVNPGETLDTNAIVSAIEVLDDPCADQAYHQCPGGLVCSIDPGTGKVTGTWSPPQCFAASGYEVMKDGEKIASLPGTATSFTDTLSKRVARYEVRPSVPAGEGPCAPMACSVTNPLIPFEIPLRINMGGEFAIDSKGERWIGDGTGAGDILEIRPDDGCATNTIQDWYLAGSISAPNLDGIQAFGYDPLDPRDQAIFNSLRWDLGDDGVAGIHTDDVDFRMEIPIPSGEYLVNLYQYEGCCPWRHWKVEIEGEVLTEDVNALEYGGAARVGRAGRLSFDRVVVADGALSLGLLPCWECPPDELARLDTNAIVSAVEVLPSRTPVETCPKGLTCTGDGAGGVAGTWAPPENLAVSSYDLYRDGAKIATLPGTATTFEDEPPCRRVTLYEIVPRSAQALPCPDLKLRCVFVDLSCPFETPVRINMGGLDVIDSKGDFWAGDQPGAGDFLDIRPDDAGGAQYGEYWDASFFQRSSLAPLGFSPESPVDFYLFTTIRWDVGADGIEWRMEIPLANGTYTVSFYFAENFWKPADRRHFTIELQGEIVKEDQFAREVGVLERLTYEGVEVTDGFLRIALLPCFDCPGTVQDTNAILQALEVTGAGTGGRVFHRGDANGDGSINITDGIFVLNYLFLGGPAPACLEAANPNDDASINITDGIYILNYLFLGGPAPTAPGPPESPCGPDPAGSPTDLGCEFYDPAKC
ncbi:MAG: malectin domain-containing carbohydrate-binding protein [Planctomycetota bacterium]